MTNSPEYFIAENISNHFVDPCFEVVIVDLPTLLLTAPEQDIYVTIIYYSLLYVLLIDHVLLSETLNDPVSSTLATSELEAIASIQHVDSNVLSSPPANSVEVNPPGLTLPLVTAFVPIQSIPTSSTQT